MDVSVVIPVYNGEKTIDELCNRIKKVLYSQFLFEIILIFDCGSDNSWTIIASLMDNDPTIIKGYKLDKNHGQHYSVMSGFSKAKGNFIVTMDDDLQHDPVDIIRLIDKQKEGDFDVVYGIYPEPNHSFLRMVSSKFVRNLLAGSIPGLYKNYSPFRLLKKETALKIICTRNNSYDFVDAYLKKISNKISGINVKHNKSLNSKSNYTWATLFKHLVCILIIYSKLIPAMFLASAILILIALALFLTTGSLTNIRINMPVYFFSITGGILLLAGSFFIVLKKRLRDISKKFS